MSEEEVYMAMRVIDMPEAPVPCDKGKCAECGTDIWLSRVLTKYWRRMRILCTVCALKKMEKDPEHCTGVVTAEAMRELDEYEQSRKVQRA